MDDLLANEKLFWQFHAVLIKLSLRSMPHNSWGIPIAKEQINSLYLITRYLWTFAYYLLLLLSGDLRVYLCGFGAKQSSTPFSHIFGFCYRYSAKYASILRRSKQVAIRRRRVSRIIQERNKFSTLVEDHFLGCFSRRWTVVSECSSSSKITFRIALTVWAWYCNRCNSVTTLWMYVEDNSFSIHLKEAVSI